MSSYFYPDEVMRMLSGLAESHAAVANAVPTHVQVDEGRYARAIEEASQPVAVDTKLVIATDFRDNKLDVIPKTKEYHVQEVTLRVAYTAMPPMKKKFIRETARIVQMPIMKSFANNNATGKEDGMPKLPNNFAQTQSDAVVKPVSNVRYLEDARKRIRQSA